MIVIAAKDILVGAHVLTWLRRYSTRGCWSSTLIAMRNLSRISSRSKSGTKLGLFMAWRFLQRHLWSCLMRGWVRLITFFLTGHAMYVNLVLLLKEDRYFVSFSRVGFG